MSIVNTVRSLLMGYTPTEWETGDVITAEKLNKLENGVADASSDTEVYTATYTPDGWELDMTIEQLEDIVNNKKSCILKVIDRNYFYNDLYLSNYAIEEGSENYICIRFKAPIKRQYNNDSTQSLYFIDYKISNMYNRVYFDRDDTYILTEN